jgi:hypothetical protein
MHDEGLRMARAILAVALLAATSGASGADRDGVYAFHGVRNCWDYLIWRRTPNSVEHGMVGAWVAGYLTAYNRQTPDTVSILGKTDLRGALQWIERWCHAHPAESLGDAMKALTEEFHARRYRTVKEAAESK